MASTQSADTSEGKFLKIESELREAKRKTALQEENFDQQMSILTCELHDAQAVRCLSVSQRFIAYYMSRLTKLLHAASSRCVS